MVKGLELYVNPLPLELEEDVDLAVVIDVLRATSTIVSALAHGAKKVLPVSTISEAFALREREPDLLLAGERGGLKIEGFDLGNSPFEYDEETDSTREIVMTTSNGTTAALKSRRARAIVAASFLNFSSVISLLREFSGKVAIQCAGSGGEFSIEDFLLAGAIVSDFEHCANDACRAAKIVFREAGGSIRSFIEENCGHAKKLSSIGFAEDVAFCARIDMYNVLPVWSENGFVRG